MQIRVTPLHLNKRYPLTISRGTSAGSDNLLVEVTHGGVTGIGEMAPVNIGHGEETAAGMTPVIEEWSEGLVDLAPWEMQRVEQILGPIGAFGAARAALDMALYDWLGKRAGLPVYALVGADPARIVATSITVGINPPEIVRERVPELLTRLQPRELKVKLGSPAGVEADKAMFDAVRELTPPSVGLRVDANGGWSVDAAVLMVKWLAERRVGYIEQPLPVGQESDLAAVRCKSPIPIFADESCRFASDIPKLAGNVDGINLKLMKSGGIREGLRVIHTARAHGLMVMMGCMSESSLAIAASVHLSPLADFLDLDSHLNLFPDPCCGLTWEYGRALPSNAPGLGVRLTE